MVLFLYYNLLIETTIISGVYKRNHRDTNMQQSNRRIYVWHPYKTVRLSAEMKVL